MIEVIQLLNHHCKTYWLTIYLAVMASCICFFSWHCSLSPSELIEGKICSELPRLVTSPIILVTIWCVNDSTDCATLADVDLSVGSDDTDRGVVDIQFTASHSATLSWHWGNVIWKENSNHKSNKTIFELNHFIKILLQYSAIPSCS